MEWTDDFRTDLALEVREALLRGAKEQEIPGVESQEEETDFGRVNRLKIQDQTAGQQMGKVPGTYINIDAPALRDRDRQMQDSVAQFLAQELKQFTGELGEDDVTLVVGLGNWNATPDSLGPKVVSSLLVTRHLFEYSPPELRQGLRPVAALSPGVLGLTGVETGEIVMGVVDRIKPKLVIVVDALASRSLDRLCSTIQIADTGIHPGSGVGNKRAGITPDTLGVPVVAVGVPTVVDAITIAQDAMDHLEEQRFQSGNGMPIEQKRQVMRHVLHPFMGHLIVTPKEVDVLMTDVSRVVAMGINGALQPEIDPADIELYIN